MNNKETALLGLLIEGPKYAYQLEQDIEARGMREWTEIGFSSIYYLLNKAAERDWISARQEASAQGPPRKVYSLTDQGRTALREAVTRRLTAPKPYSAEFDLALAFLPVLTEEEIDRALASNLQHMEADLARVAARRTPSLPPHVDALFSHSLNAMQAERDWLASFIQKRGTNYE
ncbi:PadR family transcriptional regulator [bacterium]|nr:PadR family transcriptional regulator [bacterium]